eukprot:1133811-Pelagomonas_calceolata.AAC.1
MVMEMVVVLPRLYDSHIACGRGRAAAGAGTACTLGLRVCEAGWNSRLADTCACLSDLLRHVRAHLAQVPEKEGNRGGGKGGLAGVTGSLMPAPASRIRPATPARIWRRFLN